MNDVHSARTSAASISLIERIDAMLPQTQCGKCGHAGCKPYAIGIAQGEPINRCPPGGQETIAQLADLLATPVIPLDTQRGAAPALIAHIREAECIGCTKCIQACPVDAIVGAAKQMHTVLVDECTGCDLCVAPCPVDCIDMHAAERYPVTPIVGGQAVTPQDYRAREQKRNHARRRFEARTLRLQREADRRNRERAPRLPASAAALNNDTAAADLSGGDERLKRARAAVAMSRAQLTKSLKAFGHPPIAAQAAQLAQLQSQLDACERELEGLMSAVPAVRMPNPPVQDASVIKRAKVHLAMARAALGKARSAQSPAQELTRLEAAVGDAERALAHAQEPSISKIASVSRT